MSIGIIYFALCCSLKEAQSVLLKRALSNATGGEKITSVILKYIESERSRLESSSSTEATKLSSTKTFHTQRGQYTLVYTAGQSKPAEKKCEKSNVLGKTFTSYPSL